MTREPRWIDQLNEVTAYVARHGKFPATGSKDPRQAALAAWWVRQSLMVNRDGLSAARQRAVEATVELAEKRRLELSEQAEQAKRQENRARMAPQMRARSRKARKALDSPHLVPGDREVLELCADNPDVTLADLAERVEMTKTAFAAKLRSALRRAAGPGAGRSSR